MSLSARWRPRIDIDPEDFAGVVHRFQDACAAAITNMGGSIASFTGHEVLALFGYPKAYEDDAERAVHAGSILRQRSASSYGPPANRCRYEIGIATGLVVSRRPRRGRRTFYSLPPSLRSMAPADSILVAASTRKLLGRAFICDDASFYELAGISETVTACLVAGRQSIENRFSSMRGPRLTQFVGRQHELQQLLTSVGSSQSQPRSGRASVR